MSIYFAPPRRVFFAPRACFFSPDGEVLIRDEKAVAVLSGFAKLIAESTGLCGSFGGGGGFGV